MRNLIQNQKGQSLVEYLIIVAIVGIGSMAVVGAVGSNVNARFSQIVTKLGGKVEGDHQGATVSESMYHRKDLKNFMRINDSKSSGSNSSNSDSEDNN